MSSLPVPAPALPYARTPFYLALLLLAGLAGFYPSYLARLDRTDLVHHAHALTAFAWMSLLVLQATLIRLRRRPLHRAIGRTAFVLVPLLIASGLVMAWGMVHADNPFARAFGPRLAVVDLTAMAGFATFFVLAIKHRRNIHLHARYMAATGLLILPPALARLAVNTVPGVKGFTMTFHVGYLLTELVVAAMLLQAWRSRQPARPFVLLLALLVLQEIGFWAGVAVR
ncbi:MAG: hypothetical protein JF607_12860 [Burkholderiales bacterium]|nr:hypothetical protein [Burkholderiales bacterium]